MNATVAKGCVLLGVILGTGAWAQEAAPAAEAREEAVKAETPSAFMELQPAVITLGARAWEEGNVEGIGDLLLPVFSTRSGLLYMNPRSSFRDDESEMNLGAGYRQLLGDRRMIAGINAFYDRRESDANNTFDQAGLGLEFLSDWIDARANYYLPDDDKEEVTRTETGDSVDYTVRDYDWNTPFGQGNAAVQRGVRIDSDMRAIPYVRYSYEEQALEGFDCELGVRLPIPIVQDWSDVKLFAGYYFFDNDLDSPVDGWKGRVEVRALPALLLDAEAFEDDDLNGSRYYVGARMQVPFDIGAWAAGKNPFAGTLAGFKPARRNAQLPFDHRLTEMVIRDPRVQTSVSEVREVVEYTQQELLKQVRQPITQVLSDTLIYVDRDNASGIEDGTYEHPFSTISEGLAAAKGDYKTVYVYDSSAPYSERPVITKDGISLIGSGTGLPAYGGRRFASGIYPVLANPVNLKKVELPSGSLTIMADNVTVSGIEFRGNLTDVLLESLRHDLLSGNVKEPGLGDIEDIIVEGLRYSGIIALDANKLLIENNIFYGHAIGVLTLMTAVPALYGNKQPDLRDPHAAHLVAVANNRFERNLAGLVVAGVDMDSVADILKFKVEPVPSTVLVSGNTFKDNLLGAGILQVGGGLTAIMADNHFDTDLPLGIGALMVNLAGPMDAFVFDNTIEGNHTIGLGLIQEYGSMNAYVLDNTIRDCQLTSLLVDANSIEDIVNEVTKVKREAWDVYLGLSGNTITGNGRPIDLTGWIPAVSDKEAINPVIPMPDVPAAIFILSGENVVMDMEDNEFSRNRGGAMLALGRAQFSLEINVSGLHGTDNGGLFQRNDPELDWEQYFDGLAPMPRYSALVLGQTYGTVSSSWENNVMSNSRLLAMFLERD